MMKSKTMESHRQMFYMTLSWNKMERSLIMINFDNDKRKYKFLSLLRYM